MGRRKITIRQITDPKLRHITFNKRKNGLIKKAAELSLLCNVNMLLVFEDGAGNLIQFSKNKINAIGSFFQECKYNNIVELTAKQYPNFFVVNHYKKTRDLDKTSIDDDDSDFNGNQEIYSSSPPETKQEQVRMQIKDPKSKDLGVKKGNSQHINPYIPAQPKTELANFTENDRMVYQDPSDPQGRNKPKPDLRLNGPRPEDVNKHPKMTSNDISVKLPSSMPSDMPEANYNGYNPYKKDNYKDDQYRQMSDKGMDYGAASAYMPGNMDQMKRLSGVPDPLSSPFNFYPSNGRMRPFPNFGMGPFGNEEALSSMLKSFALPMGGNPPYLGKVHPNGEIDDKLLEAKVLNYLNQTQTPLNRQNVFNFPQNEYQKMSVNDVMRQGSNGNQPDYLGNHMDESREDLQAMFKGDPRFDPTGLQNGNMSSRRQHFDGYFNGFEEDYGGEKQKKLKHS